MRNAIAVHPTVSLLTTTSVPSISTLSAVVQSQVPTPSRSKENIFTVSMLRLSSDNSDGLNEGVILSDTSVSNSNTTMSVLPSKTHRTHIASESDETQELIDGCNEEMENLSIPFYMFERGLSHIGPAPVGRMLVYLKLSIKFSDLNDISALRKYPYIQNLELQGNNISDISALGNMRYLVQLDLSSNQLKDVLSFDPPPYNLQQVDLSRNQIVEIGDLSAHRFLKYLNLDHNCIQEISKISNCRYLRHLCLANNAITSIHQLANLPLQILDVRCNRITSLEGIETLTELEQLHLGMNQVSTIANLKNHPSLRLLDIEDNQISSIDQLLILQTLPLFHEARFLKNPFTCQSLEFWLPTDRVVPMHANAYYPPSYRLRTIFLLQKLTILDSMPISPNEKIASINTYDPVDNVVISIQHAHMEKKQAQRHCRIKAEELMRAQRLRPVVLCGPNGAGKRTLTSRLLKEFPHIYGLTVSHTTRRPRSGEEDGVHYHFVSHSEMKKLNDEGKFIEAVKLFGNMYGTTMDAVDKVTEEGKICIMDLELEGVLALRKSHLNPRFIYVTTPNMTVLQARLQARLDTPATKTAPVDVEIKSQVEKASQGEDGTVAHDLNQSVVVLTTEGAIPDIRGPVESEVNLWLAKAKNTNEGYNKSTFDFTVVNDNLERAYEELKEYCLGVYWKDFEAEEQE
ncbi:guanylate kinase [Batrachochytrium salamandrivorans]|nr:hypothetical protein BASA83_003064 [Batrachochytrium salamandrivorans]KAJ1336792.1 guanylate kinase [Batrachochytrium salamandrivorans]